MAANKEGRTPSCAVGYRFGYRNPTSSAQDAFCGKDFKQYAFFTIILVLAVLTIKDVAELVSFVFVVFIYYMFYCCPDRRIGSAFKLK